MVATSTKVIELVKAFGDAVVDAKLATELGDKARSRAIVGGNIAHMMLGEERSSWGRSKLLEILYDKKHHYLFLSSSGIAHLLYAPPSTGKTSALVYFMKDHLDTTYGACASHYGVRSISRRSRLRDLHGYCT